MDQYIPDMYKKSIYDIDYKKLKKIGIKCLLFDLDNTIAQSKAEKPTKKIKILIESLKEEGFRIIILTNAFKKRVKPFSNELNVEFIHRAHKPSPKGYSKVLNKYKYKLTEVTMIGDQLKTDILGGNRVGITTILVNPISKKEMIFTKINRFFENRIFKKLGKKDLLRKGQYYD